MSKSKKSVRKVGPVSAETGVTKYGSRSNPGKGHFFRWPDGAGVGTGKCIHCECRLKFVPKGPREGLVRQYAKKGDTSFSEKEIACSRKAASKPATTKKAA